MERIREDKKWKKAAGLVLLTLTAPVAYLLINGFGIQEKKELIQAAMGAALLLFLLRGAVWGKQKRLTAERAVWLIMCGGFVVRIGYMLYTPCTDRGHDLFMFDAEEYGKAGYLLRLIQKGALPDRYDVQLYQQPLFYILGAGFSKAINGILGREDVFSLVDAAKTVSCSASCLSLVAGKGLLEFLAKEKKTVVFGMLLLSFTPVFTLTGGRVGENALCFLFMALALLYTFYWQKKPDWKNTVLLALIYGLGMQTKISCAVPAIYTAVVFGKKLFAREALSSMEGRAQEKPQKRILALKLLVFGMISFPLGLWYSLRNFLLFGQSFTYVLAQDESGPLFRGTQSLMQRFIIPDVENLLKTPYANPSADGNLPVYLLKSELFGEFEYELAQWIPVILLLLNLILTVAAVFYFICLVRRGQQLEDKTQKAVILFGLFAGFAIYSYFCYPFGCTMDFRYYMMLTVGKALLLMKLLEHLPRGRYADEMRSMHRVLWLTGTLFAVFAALFLLLI